MLNISNLTKTVGGSPLYSAVSFQVNPGEKVGLVGPNGAGKTTLFRLIIGEDKPDAGSISMVSKLRWSYFSQHVGEMKGAPVLDVVLEGDQEIKKLHQEIESYQHQLEKADTLSESAMNQILEKMGDAQTTFERLGGYEIESRAQDILTGLGILPKDHHRPIEEFSGGWKMRIALARALVIYPDLIIMDEPTNYLDMETILWLESWLRNFPGAIFMTTHDRDFMNNVCNKIVELDQGKATTYSGNYDFYLKEKKIRLTQIEATFNRQQDMIAKEEEFIARFKARASHAAQVQSRVKKLDKIDRVEVPIEQRVMSFSFPEPERGGDDVVVIKNLTKAWVPGIFQFQNLSATIKRTEKIAVVGVNGAGKSTLLQVITHLTEATEGSSQMGPSIKMGYFGQRALDQLNPEKTIFESVHESIPEASMGLVNNLLAAFLFPGEDVKKKIKFLSGGERARVLLAKILTVKNNFLVLDEPTNHLDIKSREVLLDYLVKFSGTLIFVSHDRYFLSQLSMKVWEVDHGQIHIYPGTYPEYLEKKSNKK
jgi:ATP-binding cassette subfamily F protein 3